MEELSLEIEEMPDKPLNEIYQSVEMKFAFLSEDNKQVYVFAKCRDFLHDIVRASITGKPAQIYGCDYNPSKHPRVCESSIRMLVRSETCRGDDQKVARDEVMESALALIHHYEEIASLKERSTVVRLEKSRKGTTWLFTGPQFWLSSSFFVSLYSFLIRLGDKKISFSDNDELKAKFKEISDKLQDNDSTYLRTLWSKIDVVVKNYSVIKNGMKWDASYYRDDIPISKFHNSGGIVSIAQASSYSTRKNERVAALFDGKPIPNHRKKKKKKEDETHANP